MKLYLTSIIIFSLLVTSFEYAQSEEEYLTKGDVLYDSGNFREAIDHYDKAIQINPNDHVALTQKGKALFELQLYDEASSNFDRAILSNPNYADAVANKAKVLFYLGNTTEATNVLYIALLLDPNNETAKILSYIPGSAEFYKKIPGFMEIIRRDVDGNLVAYQKTSYVAIPPSPLVEDWIKGWSTKKVTGISGDEVEVYQKTLSFSTQRESVFPEYGLKYLKYNTFLFSVYTVTHGQPSQFGDKVTLVVSIYKSFSLNN